MVRQILKANTFRSLYLGLFSTFFCKQESIKFLNKSVKPLSIGKLGDSLCIILVISSNPPLQFGYG